MMGGGGGMNPLSKLMGGGNGGNGGMSGSMQGFFDCLKKVDNELQKTDSPWFFENEYPTMIDFVYVSHVERMLASCAYWKGLNLRDPKWGLNGINRWLDAFEKREHYLAFKSDYYTHVKDIPPQYGPGYDGGFEKDREAFSKSILGKVGDTRSYCTLVGWIIPVVSYFFRCISRMDRGIFPCLMMILFNHSTEDHLFLSLSCKPLELWRIVMVPINQSIQLSWLKHVVSWQRGNFQAMGIMSPNLLLGVDLKDLRIHVNPLEPSWQILMHNQMRLY